MARLGYRSQIFDTRTEVVTHDRAAELGTVAHVADYAAAGPLIGHPELTAVVVMTADYLTDGARVAGDGGAAVSLRRPDGRQAQDQPDLLSVAGGGGAAAGVGQGSRAGGAGYRQRHPRGDCRQRGCADSARAGPETP